MPQAASCQKVETGKNRYTAHGFPHIPIAERLRHGPAVARLLPIIVSFSGWRIMETALVALSAIIGLTALVWSGVSLLGVIYPFRPFRTRRRAIVSLGGSLAAVVATIAIVATTAEQKPEPVAEAITAPSTPAPPAKAEVGKSADSAPTTRSEPTVKTTQPVAAVHATSAAGTCADPATSPGDVVAVSDEHTLHVSPNGNSDRVVNAKASQILGKTQYHQIDRTTTVRRLCVTGDWTEVQIVTPDWLTSVRGWVPNSALRFVEKSSDGARVFVEEDFYWDEDTSKFKKQLIAVVNKIARENDNCPDPDPGTVAKSSTKSKPNDPVFFVTCGTGADVFNVWFRPGDATDEKTFDAARPISKVAAVDACEAVAREAATHPSTVNFSRFMDLSYFAHKNGNVRLTSTFTAKNAFDLELKYDIYCFFEGAKMVEHSITEASR